MTCELDYPLQDRCSICLRPITPTLLPLCRICRATVEVAGRQAADADRERKANGGRLLR